MKAVVGLGNVGKKYKRTRHNVGFMFVEAFPKNRKDIILLKPKTMMNMSGKAAKALATYYMLHTTDLYVVHDDLDLKLGEYKIQFGKGPKVHNGVNSVEEHLGTSEFWRVRIGVDNRDTDNRIPGEAYVLENFSRAELETVNKTIDKAVKELAETL